MLAKKIQRFEDESIEHGFITRNGGVSNGIFNSMNFGATNSGDTTENVSRNFEIIANHYGIEPQNINHIYQVHSPDVVKIISQGDHNNNTKADALVTNLPNIMLLIKTADCCPILFKDSVNKVIGAAHAGWRGAIAGVIENTLKAMVEIGAEINNIEAAIGPTIRQKTYEVDDVFYNTFMEQDESNKELFIPSINTNKYMFDLPAYCVRKLKETGISQVHDIDINTYENEQEFHSCRRAFHRGETAFGVHGSVIMIKNK